MPDVHFADGRQVVDEFPVLTSLSGYYPARSEEVHDEIHNEKKIAKQIANGDRAFELVPLR